MMKKLIGFVLLALLTAAPSSYIQAQDTPETSNTSASESGSGSAAATLSRDMLLTYDYDIDIRQATEGSDNLGIDFRVLYELAKTGRSPLNLAVDVRGFRALADEVSGVNQFAGEVRLQGHVYSSGTRPLPPLLYARYLELADISLEEMTDAQDQEMQRLTRLMERGDSRYLSYDLHYRTESTSDLDSVMHAFGMGVSSEIPWLHSLLDVIPALVSIDRPETFKTQPVRARFACEYVKSPEAWGTYREDRDMGRLRVEAAWSTMILNGLTVRATWEGEYLWSTPDAIAAADREFNSFFQAWVLLDLNGNTGVELKYIDGHLPPDYRSASGAGLGLNIVFSK